METICVCEVLKNYLENYILHFNLCFCMRTILHEKILRGNYNIIIYLQF